jgi:hypothetical protein
MARLALTVWRECALHAIVRCRDVGQYPPDDCTMRMPVLAPPAAGDAEVMTQFTHGNAPIQGAEAGETHFSYRRLGTPGTLR